MLTPASLFRMLTEMMFVLLGGFLAFLGLSNRFMFNPRSPAWLGLGAILIYWGVRGWMNTTRAARTADRIVVQVGAISLILTGLLMFSLIFAHRGTVGSILAITGGLLALRGLAGALLSLRMG